MSNKVMIGQYQVKQMIQSVVVDDINVTNRLAATFRFSKHVGIHLTPRRHEQRGDMNTEASTKNGIANRV